ncbi:c-type cytochrome biogenesis protein CcmI [Thiospirillum jenense]|uniref:C-type cytochrome biogenesis protein CcmI n=1 Tax=Thiospirillum jenense TaxID=1653858 RepID=A0A839HIP0_9GAMM|nr:c-type cytochrome biogenesis protein CcmI [Thiospirillum jenense]MBB1126727.1 c-type cytochrome biogenesis protein CcmI [Thiospirillum jenense]
MTPFWMFATGLLLLTALFITTPLWLRRRSTAAAATQDQLNLNLFQQRCAELEADLATGLLDATQYDAARRDLERELLHDVPAGVNTTVAPTPREPASRWLTVLAAAGAVPALAVGLYFIIGNPTLTAALPPAAATAQMPPLDVLAERLTERLQQTPDNLDGWLMLGQTQFALGRPAEALAALERAYALAPEQSEVMLAYAEALAANNHNSLAGRPTELIANVLAREPTNVTALWLNGMAAFQQQQFAAAINNWQQVLTQIDPAGEEAKSVQALIAEAQQELANEKTPSTPPASSIPPAAQSNSPQ